MRRRADFLSMCRTPELASEVTLQPVDSVGVDAAIIFSDILVVPAAMGMDLKIEESRGPFFPEPVRSRADIEALHVADPERHLRYVIEAIALTRRTLAGRVPLIGFAGSPFTLACYMIEGAGSPDYAAVRRMAHARPDLLQRLVAVNARAVAAYLNEQIAAGADAVMLFDTWGGLLTAEAYRSFSLASMRSGPAAR